MLTIVRAWLEGWRQRRWERLLVGRLLQLNDHHLADIGLRRDQLQPDGIHVLDAESRPSVPQPAFRQHAKVRPALQGCG